MKNGHDIWITFANPQSPTKASGVMAGAGRKIIFIEDDDAVRNATALFLKLDGYSVAGVATLRELDELLDKFDGVPSLVISDFQLRHDEFGADAIKRARAKYGHELPAIMLTGDVSIVPKEVIADSKTRLLDKPIDVSVLTSTIGELLGA
jgi:DNA-binding response OmpR family regulator